MKTLDALPQLTTTRLVMTIPGPDDAQTMVQYFLDNRQHLAPWDPPHPDGFYTEPFWRKQLSFAQRDFQQGRSVRLALRRREEPDGPIIGRVSFSNIVRGAFQSCYLGYSVDHRFEGRGYMSEALRCAVDYTFEELKLHRIQANYIPTNERSGLLLRRLGFNVEGYARDYLFINGAWRDHIMTARLNPALKSL